MIQMRTSWNSSSEELGLRVRGATVPPTLPEAPTWGNKFPTSSAPALFLPLLSKPKGPTLKKAGWGWGTPTDLTVGSEEREGHFKFFNIFVSISVFCKSVGFRLLSVCSVH